MKTLLSVFLSLVPFIANAGTAAYVADIQDIWVFTKDAPPAFLGKAEVVLKGAPIQLGGCLTNSILINTQRTDDPNGPALLANVLAAKLSGKQIQVNVTNDTLVEGRCVLRYLSILG